MHALHPMIEIEWRLCNRCFLLRVIKTANLIASAVLPEKAIIKPDALHDDILSYHHCTSNRALFLALRPSFLRPRCRACRPRRWQRESIIVPVISNRSRHTILLFICL